MENKHEFKEVMKALEEYYGKSLSVLSIGIYFNSLKEYSNQELKAAIESHIKDAKAGKYFPKVADIISKMPCKDNRISANEAWAIANTMLDDADSVVTNDEITEALGCVRSLEDDHVAMRMAFIEAYKRIVERSINNGVIPQWYVSWGYDKALRHDAAEKAKRMGIRFDGTMLLESQKPAGLLENKELSGAVQNQFAELMTRLKNGAGIDKEKIKKNWAEFEKSRRRANETR